MSRDADLLTMQQIDDHLAELRREQADITTRLEGDEAVAAADASYDAQRELIAQLTKDQRQLDAALQDIAARIERDEGRLYSGTIASVKEMEGLQHEVTSLKERRSALEEEGLALLETLDTEDATLATLTATRDQEHARWDEESAAMRARLTALAGEIATAEEDRENQRALIDRPTLTLYDMLLQRRGVAVARLRGANCSGCRVQVPDAVRRHVLDSSILARCSNCERILVFGA